MTTTVSAPAAPRAGIPAAVADPALLGRVLVLAIAFFTAAHVVGVYLRFGLGHDVALGFVPLFNLDNESSVPTWFSEILLAACGAALALVAWRARREGDRFRTHWTWLAIGFFYLSADEAAVIHERVAEPVRRVVDVGGLLHFAWVIPALAVVCLVGLAYIGLLRALPARVRSGVVLAGALYVGGALGFEMLEGLYVDARGIPLSAYKADLGYALIASVEEVLEIAGAALFLHVLVRYLVEHRPTALRFAPARSGGAPRGS